MSDALPRQITELVVEVTAAHIGAARQSSHHNPIALALDDALEEAGLMASGQAWVPVQRGLSTTEAADTRRGVDRYETNITWHALLFGLDVALPRMCQIVLSAFQYGPQSGPFAVRGRSGEVVSMRPYEQIVRPFSFCLAFLAPAPKAAEPSRPAGGFELDEDDDDFTLDDFVLDDFALAEETLVCQAV